MIYVTSQVNSTTGLNLKFIRTGFFVVNNVGILFRNKMIIPTVAQESPNNKFPCKIIWKKNQIIRDLEIYKVL